MGLEQRYNLFDAVSAAIAEAIREFAGVTL